MSKLKLINALEKVISEIRLGGLGSMVDPETNKTLDSKFSVDYTKPDTDAPGKVMGKFTGTVDSVWDMIANKVIDNLEGGYWNAWQCPSHPFPPSFLNSGETLFGIDRKAGGWDSRTDTDGPAFFKVIDDEKGKYPDLNSFCKTWVHTYRGGSLEDTLKGYAINMMKHDYDWFSDLYFIKKGQPGKNALDAVNSDKRLIFHFAYAVWNGPGFFQTFANDMIKAVSEGKTGDELVESGISSRDNSSLAEGDWAATNSKVKNIMRNDADLQS
jgi:hypothetical protein